MSGAEGIIRRDISGPDCVVWWRAGHGVIGA